MYVPKIEIVSCVFVSFLVILSPVYARHKHNAMCEGGRQEGDKWFDGCKWCVCQRSGPLCSSAQCSDLSRRVPPCTGRGTRWRDGCYHCACHSYGIECQTDRACVILMQSVIYQRQLLNPGACVYPKDDRCVCGVDGVPSCTVEVIDRNAHPATTVAFDANIPFSPLEGPSRLASDGYDSYEPSPEPFRRIPFRSLESIIRRPRIPKTENTDSYKTPYAKATAEDEWLNRDFAGSVYPQNYNRRATRYRRNADKQWRLARVSNNQGQLVQIPVSLLVITDNRCRYGTRWYGGSLRCFCDLEGSVTCGDPSFVATRIDGFVLQKTPCEEDHAWEETGSCQECHCQINGVVLCQRSDSCPLPFLIKPIARVDANDNGPADRFDNRDEEERDDRMEDGTELTKRPGDASSIDVNLENENRKESSTSNFVNINRHRNSRLPFPVNPPRGRVVQGTTVVVHECKPGSRWLEGCKRCKCPNGRKVCDEQRCLKPRPVQPFQQVPHSIKDKVSGRPFQRPPSIHVIRQKPVSVKPPPIVRPASCGSQRIGDYFWIKCNLCRCLRGGLRCEAKSCA